MQIIPITRIIIMKQEIFMEVWAKYNR